MRKKMPLISIDEFMKRTQSICPIKTQIISRFDTYSCGCQSKHTVGWNGGKIIRQISRYEFIILCPKGYLTLIEYNCQTHDIQSLLSTKIQDINADLVQMEERFILWWRMKKSRFEPSRLRQILFQNYPKGLYSP